jgi:prevent-host-death family protein
MRSVSAAEANRSFSKLLSEVKRGAIVTITSHGEPVAKLVPFVDVSDRDRREAAKQAMLDRWATLEPWTADPWTRDDLYEDDPKG